MLVDISLKPHGGMHAGVTRRCIAGDGELPGLAARHVDNVAFFYPFLFAADFCIECAVEHIDEVFMRGFLFAADAAGRRFTR